MNHQNHLPELADRPEHLKGPQLARYTMAKKQVLGADPRVREIFFRFLLPKVQVERDAKALDASIVRDALRRSEIEFFGK